MGRVLSLDPLGRLLLLLLPTCAGCRSPSPLHPRRTATPVATRLLLPPAPPAAASPHLRAARRATRRSCSRAAASLHRRPSPPPPAPSQYILLDPTVELKHRAARIAAGEELPPLRGRTHTHHLSWDERYIPYI
ncbi:hypothetical protein U9M48_043886 [Paspalum notatum var. saurae]|uniref:Uncharacterized protein n=1 Tax=Paspalum notatum var. saurae TaxID=547442 RepID=A0AAQ3XGX8_PASNO